MIIKFKFFLNVLNSYIILKNKYKQQQANVTAYVII